MPGDSSTRWRGLLRQELGDARPDAAIRKTKHASRSGVTGIVARLLLTALLGAACGSSSDVSAPSGSRTTGSTAAPTTKARPPSDISWTSCGDRLECAKVPVPLDWKQPDGQAIDLAVIRHPASRPDQRIGAIFSNPGGPGDTGVGFIRDGGDDLDAWGGGRFDWVSWDPRGTYASTPVNCFHSEADGSAFWRGAKVPSTPAEADALARQTEDLARRCGEVMGPVLSHVSTTDTVRDMDRLRELLGEDTITYVGLSYGTFIGQMYANLFPQRVRAMMLDGLVDPISSTASAEDRLANQTNPTNDVFEQFLLTCETAGPDKCALAGHGETPKARVARLFDQAKQAPIPAPNANPPGELTYSDLLVASFAPLRDPQLWPGYAEQLNDAVDGDPSALATTAAQSQSPAAWNEATKSSAISCLDGAASNPVTDWRAVIGDATTAESMSLPVLGWWLWAPCASNWPAHSDDRYTGPWNAKTNVPVLLIGTRHDPNTSYQNAVDAQKRLGNAVLLTHEGYGHLSPKDESQCVETARVRYLVDLEPPAEGTVCQADKKPFQ